MSGVLLDVGGNIFDVGSAESLCDHRSCLTLLQLLEAIVMFTQKMKQLDIKLQNNNIALFVHRKSNYILIYFRRNFCFNQ